ncbi:MAG: hypothetical protein HQ567_06220 [Candidatus Nealsonbacteria bacterium]|nr:hypothetical protein [Candidatus Nealsonbacteria bacterium]
MNERRIGLSLLILACLCGCDERQQTNQRGPAPAPTRVSNEELLRAVAGAEREAAGTVPPESVIKLPSLENWIRSERRPLPPDDHGFTVAYDHPTGVSVTLYQFTRGLTEIPDDLTADEAQTEMRLAKFGIEQAVQLGHWQTAEETDNRIATLGDSSRRALWSRHKLTVGGNAMTSDTHVWVHANTFFKLRCTGQSVSSETETSILSPLLTALGNASQSQAK